MSSPIAIKADRRIVAIAIFRAHTFRYAEALNLASAPEVAKASALDFVVRNARRFDVQLAALEDAHAADEARSVELLNGIEDALREVGIPTKRFGKQAIFEAFAVEPLTSRKQFTKFWLGSGPN